MSVGILIATELALIVVALGFLLESQSNSTMSNVVAGLIIILGICCLAYAISRNTTVPTKEVPVFSLLSDSPEQVKVVQVTPTYEVNLG